MRGTAGCSVTFDSWTVKTLNHPVKRKTFLSHLNHLKVDIAFLQEKHLRTFDHSRLKGQSYYSHFHSKTRGGAILISKNIRFAMSSVEADSAGRFIIVV
jgi:exonuclease III